MNDTYVTVVGNVVNSPTRKRLESGAVTNFRIASNARRFDAAKQESVPAGTFFADVECWGDLGGNVSRSISKGDSVLVTGTLTTREWETENGRGNTSKIRAEAVGPNLRWGWTEFRKPQRSASPPEGASESDAADGAGNPPDEDSMAGRSYDDDSVPDYTEGSGPLYETEPASVPQPARA